MLDPMKDNSEGRLETPKQLAKRVGISERQIRQLLRNGQLSCVIIGCRVHIPVDEWPRFIAANRGKLWHEETTVQGCATSQSASATTSLGQNTAAAASARLARQTAMRLKSSSVSGYSADGDETARVIPLRSL
jgi:hypothetical protein